MGIFDFFFHSNNSGRNLPEEEYAAYKKYLENKKSFEGEKKLLQQKEKIILEKEAELLNRERKIKANEDGQRTFYEGQKKKAALAKQELGQVQAKYNDLLANYDSLCNRTKDDTLKIEELKKAVSDLEEQAKEENKESIRLLLGMQGEFSLKEKKLERELEEEREKLEKCEQILKSTEPFASVSSLYADVSSCLLCDGTLEVFKNSKKHLKAEDRLREIKEKYKQDIAALKEYQYKFEYLLKVAPDLSDYLLDDDSMKSILYSSSNDLKADGTYLWLSREEYDQMNEDERAQLALDRYMASHNKNNWEIGRDYETFVAWKFFNEKQSDGVTPKYRVIQEGCNKKLEDRGRDVIAINKATGKVYIIQCKMWSKDKVIHEKHIFQLYGSALDYVIRNDLRLADVEPVFVTTIQLSDYARRCADLLHVTIREDIKMGEYAPIKLNINEQTGEKIYHLPIDQQYDRVKLENEGEGYAFTVAEAVEKGFRRAHRFSKVNHCGKGNNS